MPSEKGYVYSVVQRKEDFLDLVMKLFSEDYLLFVENPQNPSEFGSSMIPDSIEFPGFIFDSKKEARWYTNDGRFFVTIISDEPVPDLQKVEGNWTRERVAEYIGGHKKSDEKGIYLVDSNFTHINIKSKTLKEYLREAKVLQNAELFSRDAIPIFLTLRRQRQ